MVIVKKACLKHKEKRKHIEMVVKIKCFKLLQIKDMQNKINAIYITYVCLFPFRVTKLHCNYENK